MRASTILYAGLALAAVVAVVVVVRTRSTPRNISILTGRLTAKGKRELTARPTARGGRGHF